MTAKPLLHVVMALMLATWSPVWCQCVLSSAVAGQPHGSTMAAIIDDCCAAASQILLLDECCTSQPAPQVACCTQGEHRAGDGGCECPCCDQTLVWITTKRGADAGHDAATLGDLTFIAPACPAVLAMETSTLLRGGPPLQIQPSLSQTLLAQRCLLLI